MSKLYDKYLSLKSDDNSKIYLFKNGIFYIFLDNDARLMSSVLNLKLTNLNDKIVKCGFPSNTLNKYQDLIKNMGYDISIIDSSSTMNHSSENSISNEEIKKFLKYLSNINPDNLSIIEAYSLLNNISSKAKELKDTETKK